MLSMEPIIKRGLTFWDRSLMPADEFGERLSLMRATMKERNLDALLISGNMYEDADLIYLVGGPIDGTLLVTLDGDPCMLTVSGSRDVFFLQELTWLTQILPTGGALGKKALQALDERGIRTGTIGLAGQDILSNSAYSDLIQNLEAFKVVDFNEIYRASHKILRPREIAAVRKALFIVDRAAEAAEKIFAAGCSNTEALIEAERVARRLGARDFRGLCNIDGDALRPLERPSAARHEPLLLWLAARYQGYWADRAVGGGDLGEAAVAVNAMIAVARSGATAGSVAAAAVAKLSPMSRNASLAYGLGNEVGLTLDGDPKIVMDSSAVLSQGTLLSLRALSFTEEKASFCSAIVRIDADGATGLTAAAQL